MNHVKISHDCPEMKYCPSIGGLGSFEALSAIIALFSSNKITTKMRKTGIGFQEIVERPIDRRCTTDPFTVLEHQNQAIRELYVVGKWR